MPDLNTRSLVLFVTVLFFAAFSSFPVIWVILSSIKPYTEIYAYPITVFPSMPTLENYVKLFTETYFSRFLMNTLIVSFLTTLATAVVTTMGGYSLARFRYGGQKAIIVFSLVIYMVSPVALIVPMYWVIRNLGMLNTYHGLLLPFVAFAVPICLWLMKVFFETVPIELEEAAMVDGCTRFEAFRKVVLPQAVPGIIANSMFALIFALNEFLLPLIITETDTMFTVPIGIASWMGTYIYWEYVLPASVILMAVALAVFLFIQKWLIRGLGAGAIKG